MPETWIWCKIKSRITFKIRTWSWGLYHLQYACTTSSKCRKHAVKHIHGTVEEGNLSTVQSCCPAPASTKPLWSRERWAGGRTGRGGSQPGEGGDRARLSAIFWIPSQAGWPDTGLLDWAPVQSAGWGLPRMRKQIPIPSFPRLLSPRRLSALCQQAQDPFWWTGAVGSVVFRIGLSSCFLLYIHYTVYHKHVTEKQMHTIPSNKHFTALQGRLHRKYYLRKPLPVCK